jgi:SAM-dependent methyltransferase
MLMVLTAILSLTLACPQAVSQAATAPAEPSASVRMQQEAAGLRAGGLVVSSLGKAFLDAAADLPAIEPRTIYREKKSRQWCNVSQMQAQKAADPALEFDELIADEDRYYDTKYGTPIAYARVFDLLGQPPIRIADDFAGLKILDFGYGTIGHLRMLASRGANVTGLDVDSFLTALYSQPGDTGTIDNPTATGKDGSITLVDGRFSDAEVIAQVGTGYDLIISKNTLKRGYVQPPEGVKVDKRMLIDLGVDNETFLRALYDALKPGGRLAIYNICPKQNEYASGKDDQPYLPMADGLCPFDRALFEKVGFKALVLDQDDSKAVREMARVLGWDKGERPMDLEKDLFAWLTVLEKQASP